MDREDWIVLVIVLAVVGATVWGFLTYQRGCDERGGVAVFGAGNMPVCIDKGVVK